MYKRVLNLRSDQSNNRGCSSGVFVNSVESDENAAKCMPFDTSGSHTHKSLGTAAVQDCHKPSKATCLRFRS
jgi:hypothetical protein